MPPEGPCDIHRQHDSILWQLREGFCPPGPFYQILHDRWRAGTIRPCVRLIDGLINGTLPGRPARITHQAVADDVGCSRCAVTQLVNLFGDPFGPTDRVPDRHFNLARRILEEYGLDLPGEAALRIAGNATAISYLRRDVLGDTNCRRPLDEAEWVALYYLYVEDVWLRSTTAYDRARRAGDRAAREDAQDWLQGAAAFILGTVHQDIQRVGLPTMDIMNPVEYLQDLERVWGNSYQLFVFEMDPDWEVPSALVPAP